MSLTKISVLESARKLNTAMKTLICEQDDLPTPTVASPGEYEPKTKDQDKSQVNEGETTPPSIETARSV